VKPKIDAHVERIHQADIHTRCVQAWLSSRSPESARFSGLGVEARSTGYQIPLLNLALSKGYPTGTSNQTIHDEIENVKTFFAERNLPWYWWLGPDTFPSHLTTLLEQCGLVCDRPELPTMAATLPQNFEKERNPDIRAWLASDRYDLEAASKTMNPSP
jgi:hypothetical protein